VRPAGPAPIIAIFLASLIVKAARYMNTVHKTYMNKNWRGILCK
jgi:hypothetical protein